MKDLFLKRKQEFRKECLGYLRYVLNDHFVLFLLVLLGFLAYQYNQLLQHFPENHFPILILIGMISILLLLWGGIATYLEVPDKLFLLVAEEEVREHIQKQSLISFIFWVSVQTLFLLLFAPLFLAMGLGLPIFGVYLLVLGIVKLSLIHIFSEGLNIAAIKKKYAEREAKAKKPVSQTEVRRALRNEVLQQSRFASQQSPFGRG